LETPGLFEFQYLHSLADPFCKRPPGLPSQRLAIEADAVLGYGMMEGQPLIKARNVVYDPQSPLSPKQFAENGSSAERLAIVANEKEAFSLSGHRDVRAAGEYLRTDQKAEVVVIKRGLKGCLVFSATGVTMIPAYRLRSAFLIGSGDIFSAEFAYRWLVENASAEDAARLASLAVAYYAQSPTLPVPPALPEKFAPIAITSDETKERTVYLAGPFFNLQQLWMVEEARAQLTSQNVKVFSPLHDVGFGLAAVVAQEDLKGLAETDSLFALLDGYDPGTLFEVGFARAIGKPVTVFVSSRDTTHLTMLLGSGCDVFHDFVSAVCWELSR
jgi:hypothetical protein